MRSRLVFSTRVSLLKGRHMKKLVAVSLVALFSLVANTVHAGSALGDKVAELKKEAAELKGPRDKAYKALEVLKDALKAPEEELKNLGEAKEAVTEEIKVFKGERFDEAEKAQIAALAAIEKAIDLHEEAVKNGKKDTGPELEAITKAKAAHAVAVDAVAAEDRKFSELGDKLKNRYATALKSRKAPTIQELLDKDLKSIETSITELTAALDQAASTTAPLSKGGLRTQKAKAEAEYNKLNDEYKKILDDILKYEGPTGTTTSVIPPTTSVVPPTTPGVTTSVVVAVTDPAVIADIKDLKAKFEKHEERIGSLEDVDKAILLTITQMKLDAGELNAMITGVDGIKAQFKNAKERMDAFQEFQNFVDSRIKATPTKKRYPVKCEGNILVVDVDVPAIAMN